ncbi:MAG: hypothetical protein NC828_02620 [Candidatus Omnitrophica bacterium]|nr:hypothetical protein [Candidatus Omnitrophota bacterium]
MDYITNFYVAGEDNSALAFGQLWVYAGAYLWSATTIGGSYVIDAYKAGRERADFIRFIWSDATGASWTGNHPRVPRQ